MPSVIGPPARIEARDGKVGVGTGKREGREPQAHRRTDGHDSAIVLHRHGAGTVARYWDLADRKGGQAGGAEGGIERAWGGRHEAVLETLELEPAV